MRPLSDNHTLLLTLDPLRESVEVRPQQTIRPDHGDPDAAGIRALAALSALDRADGTLDLGETLGQGGMGVVRVAEQVAVGRRVAVKTLRSGIDSPRATMSMLREGWLTGGLEHPNVVPVYDLGLDAEGRPLILMRRIEGEHWGAMMRDAAGVADRFGAHDLLGWNLGVLGSVCNALHFAHARGIVHRDLKPENVMIGAFGEVYVLDWGIAVSLADDGSGRLPVVRGPLPVAGTPAYMAPEMLRGGPVDARTDVYLLGGILFEVLTGRAPHAGASLEELVASATAIPALPPDAPAELAELCRAALDPDPSRRPAGADVFRRALQEFVEHRASATLATEAERRLDELRALLSAAPVDHLRVYNLFGEVRFGFRQALRDWSGNQGARDRLDEAITAMVRYELGRGEPQAAELLLDELERPHAALRERLDALIRADEERRRTVERLVRDQDPSVGVRTRRFMGGVLGTIWTLSPLIGGYALQLEATHLVNLAWSGFFLVIVVALGLWARESMSATRLNRDLYSALLLVPIGQGVLSVGGTVLGLDPALVLVLNFPLWFQNAALVTLLVERRMWPTALAYGVAWLIVTVRLDVVFPMMATCNFVFTLNVLGIWGVSSPPASPAR